MNKQIFIINGSGGSGKDTFVRCVMEFMHNYFNENVWSYDSVWRIKKIAKDIGWDGRKTEKDRRFMADLKKLLIEYNDMPFKDLEDAIKRFNDSNARILFVHIREPEEIGRAVEKFGAKTILIKRNGIDKITSNAADSGVERYLSYDYVFENDGTMEELKDKAEKFIIEVVNENNNTKQWRLIHEEVN